MTSLSQPVTLQGRVWAYTPRPTGDGKKFIDDVVRRIGDPNHPDAAPAMARLTISELPTAIAELTAMGYMRPKQAKTPTPGALKREEPF